MNRLSMLGVVGTSLLAAAIVAGCSGNDGAAGKDGTNGAAGVAGAAGATGATGDAGPAGLGTTPSLGVVYPRYGLLAHELDVVITAEAVTFDAMSTADFGAGITVTAPTPISATSLGVHLAIAANAVPGARDVKLTTGKSMLTGTKAFNIAAPLQVTTAAGTTMAQGGIFSAQLNDVDHPAFDTNLGVLGVASGPISVFPWSTQPNVTATNATFTFLVDPLAATGAAGFTVGNAAADGTFPLTFESSPSALTVAAATPAAVALGATGLKDTLTAGATKFYSYSAPIGITHVSLTGSGALITPVINVYPASGVFKDLLTQGIAQPASIFGAATPAPDTVFGVTAPTTGFIVVGDNALGGGAAADYGFGLNVTTTPVPAANILARDTAMPHGNISTAQAITAIPAIITGTSTGTKATLDNALFKFTGALGDIHEISLTTDPTADIVVGICPPLMGSDNPDFANCTAVAAPKAPGHSAFALETLPMPPAAAGPVYMIVQGGGGSHPGGKFTVTVRKTN